jgi:hypothetical protein
VIPVGRAVDKVRMLARNPDVAFVDMIGAAL